MKWKQSKLKKVQGKSGSHLTIVDVVRTPNEDICSGRFEGLRLVEITDLAFSFERTLLCDGVGYDINVNKNATFTAKRAGS